MSHKRVVVTGLGVVSCFSDEVDSFFDSLLKGKSGVKKINTFDVEDLSTQIAAQVAPFDAEKYISKKMVRRIDPFISYGMVGAKKAIEDAKIELSQLDLKRCGILVGSGMGGMSTFSEGVETLVEKGYKRVSPFFVPFILTNMLGGLLAIDLGFCGPNYSISTACATGTNCLVSAYEHIKNNDADLMLCGGAEAGVIPIGLAGFMACKALSKNNDAPEQASRPWDQNRDGFVMGEGAGVLVLESLEHALKRKAPIYAEIVGGAVNCDAYHMTEPKEGGLGIQDCLADALGQAKVHPEQINYINAHATSTKLGDLAEIAAYKLAFGSALKNIPINSTKSMIGHGLGAAGGLEAVVTVKTVQTGKIHPSINLKDPEEAVEGLCIPAQAIDKNVEYAISNNFGFGGHNACAIFKAFKE